MQRHFENIITRMTLENLRKLLGFKKRACPELGIKIINQLIIIIIFNYNNNIIIIINHK